MDALCTTSFNIKKFYVLPTHTVYLCILCGSQNKQRLFPYTARTLPFLLSTVEITSAFCSQNLTLKVFGPISSSRSCISNCVSDFKMVVRRLTKNKVLLFNSFSSVCFMFGYIGYWTFMPKYVETQFRQSAATASLITGKHTAYSL